MVLARATVFYKPDWALNIQDIHFAWLAVDAGCVHWELSYNTSVLYVAWGSSLGEWASSYDDGSDPRSSIPRVSLPRREK